MLHEDSALVCWRRADAVYYSDREKQILEERSGLSAGEGKNQKVMAMHLTGIALAELGSKMLQGSYYPIRTAPGGKPYFADGQLQFNISHSGEIVVCAFSCFPIGVDIETAHRDIRKIADRYYREDENTWINENGYSNEKAILLWSYKESYLKREGKGIGEIETIPSMVKDGKPVTELEGARFFTRELDGGDRIVVCADETVTQIAWQEERILYV